MRVFFILFFIFGIPSVCGNSEDPSISVKAEVNKASITIGERIEYRVTITHDPSIQILSKIVPPPSDVFEVKEAHDFSEKQGKEIVEGRRFILTTYDLGEYILDPVSVRYKTPAGEEKTIETNRLYLTVTSVDAGKPKTDIRDVKGVLDLRRRWKGLVALLTLLLLGVGGSYAWYWWRKRGLLPEGANEPPLSAEDEALLRLNQLFDSDLLKEGKIKEYFLKLSEILRCYFERRFQILAIESTTSEIIRDLRNKEVSPNLLEKISYVLNEADLVKFAKFKPLPTEIVKINQTSKAIVEEARPPAETLPTEEIQSSSHGV